MACTENFCHDIGGFLQDIRENFEKHCQSTECTTTLLPREREVLSAYIADEFMDRRTMELARCLIQNVLRSKRDKSVRQFILVSKQALTGRVNPERNIITHLEECARHGISTLVSHARFMSLATLLRCDSSPLNLAAIRRLLNDTDWRMRTVFNAPQREAVTNLLGIFHNYIVGIYCGNPARTWCPNVAYTYGLYSTEGERREFCTITEKIPGNDTIREFITSGRLTPELFLSIFAQVALTLEVMQSKYGFVHFDLHAGNVLLRPVFQQNGNGVSWSYLVYGQEYRLRDIQFLATIINFCSSCFDETLRTGGEAGLDNAFVGVGRAKRYGVMDFMIPGCDLYVFLNSIRLIILSTLDPALTSSFLMDAYAQNNNIAILEAIEYIMKDIYEVPEYVLSRDQTRNDRRYNVLLCKGAGLSPLAVVDRLSRGDTIRRILKIRQPWSVEDRNLYVPSICKKKIPAFLADIMPNWKSIVQEDKFLSPAAALSVEEIPDALDTLLEMIESKKILKEFDYRPLMLSGGQVSTDVLEFYTRLVFSPEGFYYGYFKNTVLFYNLALRFIDIYYYGFHKQDRPIMDILLANNDKITIFFRTVRATGYMGNLSGMIRFGQTIANMKKVAEKNFCCTATRQSLGQMGQQDVFQNRGGTEKQQTDRDIYKIQAEDSPCAREYTLQTRQQQQQKTPQARQQQKTTPTQRQQQEKTSTPQWQQKTTLIPIQRQRQLPIPPGRQQNTSIERRQQRPGLLPPRQAGNLIPSRTPSQSSQQYFPF